MPYYRTVGEVPRKRHARSPHHEELMGSEGFSASSSLLYHRHAPTAIVAARAEAPRLDCTTPNLPLLPRHYRTGDLAPAADLVAGRRVLLRNDDVQISFAVSGQPTGLYRDATGDTLAYVAEGAVDLQTSFGDLALQSGDYVVIPTSTTHRWVPRGDARVLFVEASGHIHPPPRYLSRDGQFLEQAPYSERDLRAPAGLRLEDGEADVLVRHRGGLTTYTYRDHPFDVVGWDGCLYPYALSIHDFEPIVKRFHAPPPVHQTFEGPGFVVCSFCPRPYDFDPDAVPVPYNHANVDSDEVLFYAGGDFMSRRGSGIGKGSISLHPAGFVHGPQPGSAEAARGQPATQELAVMIDTFHPLEIGDTARSIEDPEYAWTWAR